MSDNKVVKTIIDAATLTGLASGIGWIAKKVVKENMTADPNSNVMNYAKFTAVMTGSIALKRYLEDQKILQFRQIEKRKTSFYMASVALMIGDEILNAAALTGGNYLAKYLSGDDGKAALEEKTRHDKALEAYQAAMAKYTRVRIKRLDRIETNRQIKDQAKQDFTNTDYAFKLYNQTLPIGKSPSNILNSLTFISQARNRNKASCFLLAGAHLRSAMPRVVFFELSRS